MGRPNWREHWNTTATLDYLGPDEIVKLYGQEVYKDLYKIIQLNK